MTFTASEHRRRHHSDHIVAEIRMELNRLGVLPHYQNYLKVQHQHFLFKGTLIYLIFILFTRFRRY